MITIDPKLLSHNMCQSQAALLAVITEDIRSSVEENADSTMTGEERDLIDALYKLNECCLQSIKQNDGKITYWVGQAAKQANPMLANS